MQKSSANNVRLDATLRVWQASLRVDLQPWAKAFCGHAAVPDALLRACEKKVPLEELLDLLLRLKRIDAATQKRESEASRLRERLYSARDDIALVQKLKKNLRRKAALLPYINPMLPAQLELAENAFAGLPSKRRGQPQKASSTYCFVALAAFFQEKTGDPCWGLVADLSAAAFQSDVDESTVRKRVARLKPLPRAWSGAPADAIKVPPMKEIEKLPIEDRRAWIALLFAQAEKDMLDLEAGRLRRKRADGR